MMRKVQTQPFFFEAGPRAVLLLHGFTGSSSDVRMLGRFLEKKGYTTYAPHYRGHGVPPEELIQSNADEWWTDVLAAYENLKEQGYQEIAVAGLSLGGVLALKLGVSKPLKGIITMCSPMTMRTTSIMFEGVINYAREYKQAEKKSLEEIEKEIVAIQTKGMPSLVGLQQLVQNVRHEIDHLYTPIFVAQATHDEVIDPQSATIIYNRVESDDKHIKWYEDSKHVITLGNDKEQLHEDIYHFLESLNWAEEDEL